MKKYQNHILIEILTQEPKLSFGAINRPNINENNPTKTWCYGVEIGLLFFTINLLHLR